MSRESNFENIYNAVQQTELERSFPNMNESGRMASVPGIRWSRLTMPRPVHFQVALESMIVVCNLALKHSILLCDRDERNVMFSPVGDDAGRKVIRDETGYMRIVQIDFDSVKYEFNGLDLRFVLLDCIHQLVPSGRYEWDNGVTEISEILKLNPRSNNNLDKMTRELREYQHKFIDYQHTISLTDQVIANNRR